MTVKHLFPAVEPSLNLDFANSKKLDPRITFTRSSTGTYVDSNGVIKTAAANEARFDHDPVSGSSLGLLIEESRTNLVLYSEDLTQSNWAKYGVTITSNAVAAPDGLTTADKMFSTAGAALLAVQQAKTGLTNAAQYTRSVFFKAAELTSATMQIGGTTEGTISCVVDLSSGTSTNGGVVTTYPNGWYKVERTFTMSGTTNDFYLRLPDSSATNNGVYIWGAQLEAGTFPTSYIATSGSTVTRSADTASITGTNFSSWYNQSEGTYLLDATTPNDSTSGAIDILITDGYLDIRDYVGGGISRRVISSSDFNINPAQAPVSKVAVAFDSTSANAAYAGTLQTLDTTISNLPNTSTQLSLGNSGQPGSLGRGHFARLTYYPYRLTDAQLQALTL